MVEEYTKLMHVVGNIGPQTIDIEGRKSETVLGGSLTQVAVVAASLKYPSSLFGALESENGDWAELEPELNIRGVDTASVKPSEMGIEFVLKYDSELHLVDLLVEKSEMQAAAVSIFKGYVEKLEDIDSDKNNFITYICPLPSELQADVVEVAQDLGPIALTTHFNLLQSSENVEIFQSLIPKADFLSLNEEEARILTNKENAIEAGAELSCAANGGLVIVTHGVEGAKAYQNGDMIGEMTPEIREDVVDVTGAGDVFFSTLIVRLIQEGWDGRNNDVVIEAMNFAQRMVEAKLGQYGFAEIVDLKEYPLDQDTHSTSLSIPISKCHESQTVN